MAAGDCVTLRRSLDAADIDVVVQRSTTTIMSNSISTTLPDRWRMSTEDIMRTGQLGAGQHLYYSALTTHTQTGILRLLTCSVAAAPSYRHRQPQTNRNINIALPSHPLV